MNGMSETPVTQATDDATQSTEPSCDAEIVATVVVTDRTTLDVVRDHAGVHHVLRNGTDEFDPLAVFTNMADALRHVANCVQVLNAAGFTLSRG